MGQDGGAEAGRDEAAGLEEAWAMLVLRGTPGLGPVRIKDLLEPEDGVPSKTAVAVLAERRGSRLPFSARPVRGRRGASASPEARAEHILASARRHQVAVVPVSAPGYPLALKTIYDPPPVLFVRGTMPPPLFAAWEELRVVAVVGTRDPTARARRWAEEVGRDLAAAGVVVVSGLAHGIDGAAHEGAVEAAGAPAVAVLAGGLDVVRPAIHQRLAERILAGGGALVSEDPPGTSPHPHDFVARNRIVSGLSLGVVVVEAGARSGALHTADFAEQQGREVMVVPDHPLATRARGNLRLLGAGCPYVLGSDDVLRHLELGSALPVRVLPPEDRAWLEQFAERGPCPVDALGGEPVEAAITVSRLELEGWLDRDGSGRYRLTATGRRALEQQR